MARARKAQRARTSTPRARTLVRASAPQLKAEEVAIVLLGAFNPSIFQPAWMASQGVLDESEASAAEIGIIHPDVVSFRVGAIAIEVLRERFQAQTTDASAFESLRDLVVGVFGRLLHTPIGAMGINRSTHHELPSHAAWNRLGHRLVPKDPWEPVMNRPGTKNITIEGTRDDSRVGYVRAIFEPSTLIEQGVFQTINDHYQFNEGDPQKNIPASDAMTTLAEVWSDSLSRARAIADHILTLA